jgi:hypothetical protein
VGYVHFKVVIFYIASKFTLILKLTSQNVFFCKCVMVYVSKTETTHADMASS